ncbi:hypothetical protein H4582DRAFT_1259460 [Lactarius indigo]|nr:hypothetical protein H4582DRAFT_1259460 [Lactarius indigo]
MQTMGPTDSPSGSDVLPIPTPDKDGVSTCNICHMKVRVGCGGDRNFMQHRGSPKCLRAAQKGELKSQESQTRSRTRTLHSYFTKTLTKTTRDGPKDGLNRMQDGKRNGLASEDSSEVTLASTVTSVYATLSASATPLAQSSPVPTSSLVSSLPTSGLPREPRVGSLSADGLTSKSAHPDAHVLTLLNGISCAAQELPSHIPEAEEGDVIARVVLARGTSSAPSDISPSDPDGAPLSKPWIHWVKPPTPKGSRRTRRATFSISIPCPSNQFNMRSRCSQASLESSGEDGLGELAAAAMRETSETSPSLRQGLSEMS